MGFFSKSALLILLVAVSTPLIYRRFATDDTIKFMSSYYSNYKVIDQFLRQTAGHMDRTKDYLPDNKQVTNFVDNVRTKVGDLIETSKNKLNDFKTSMEKSEQKTDQKQEPSQGKQKQQQQQQKPKAEMKVSQQIRMTSCPGEKDPVRLWSKEELAKFDGSNGEVYVGFLGLVYNVTINLQHYGPGTEYSVFAGRDATRAFVTGNFTHDLTDDIRDIDESFYSHVESWASFYSNSYQALGRIQGAFFDSRGCETKELARVYQMFQKLAEERAEQKEQETSLPECNSEWNADLKGGRVWCTNKSGGVERDWAGVPRLMEAKNESEGGRCVCVNLDTINPSEQSNLKLYPDCEPKASECKVIS